MTNHQAQVFINEGTFGIFDNGEVPIESADWSGDLIAPMSAGAMVRTGINTGNVQVEVRAEASPGEWEDEASALVWSPTGSLRIESVVNGPRLDLPVLSTSGPGWYELEVKARGRRQAPDASVLESAADRAALGDYFGGRPADRLSRHVCTNVLVTVTSPETATATTYFTTYRVDGYSGGLVPPRPPPQVGRYEDTFQKVNGGWLLSRRNLFLSFAGATERLGSDDGSRPGGREPSGGA